MTEKRRRERINNSLMQLKSLVLRDTNKEVRTYIINTSSYIEQDAFFF